MKKRIEKIMESKVAIDWVKCITKIYPGDKLCYQLYLDLDDDTLIEYCEASSNTWHQRPDCSLVLVQMFNAQFEDPTDDVAGAWENLRECIYYALGNN